MHIILVQFFVQIFLADTVSFLMKMRIMMTMLFILHLLFLFKRNP